MRSLFLASLCMCVCACLGALPAWQLPSAAGLSLNPAVGGMGRFADLLAKRRSGSSLFGNRVRGISSIFSHLSSKVRQPICFFDKMNVPQFDWPTKSKLCFESSPPYPYDRVYDALVNDPDALEYMILVQQCYVRNQMNYTGQYPKYRYKDLCESNTRLLERIWWTNTISGAREMCYVIMPEAQGVGVADCGRKRHIPSVVSIQKNCMMDNTPVQNHYCVPDGFVDRDIYVFCPGELVQCRRTRVSVPTGCSCKKYECLKYRFL